MSNLVFISWAPFCSRSDNIAREFGGESILVYHAFWGSNYATILLKYLTQSVAALWHLLRKRPARVIVMSPPVIACLPIWMYCCFFNATYAIDAHTAAFVAPPWRTFGFLQRFFSRRAVTTIVTNSHWQALIRTWAAPSDIISDVPVQFPKPTPIELSLGPKIAVVCTFTFDEPVSDIFRAARLLPD